MSCSLNFRLRLGRHASVPTGTVSLEISEFVIKIEQSRDICEVRITATHSHTLVPMALTATMEVPIRLNANEDQREGMGH